MKKMKLDLDALTIDSFDPLPGGSAASRGTVKGHSDPYAECGTMNTGCCTQADDVGCSGDPGCGGIGTANCGSDQCTWMPGWGCMTNPIAYPTTPCGNACPNPTLQVGC